jgi:hypothetical protein
MMALNHSSWELEKNDLISVIEAGSVCRFNGFDKLPFDELRVCDTASRLGVPSEVEGLALAATRSRASTAEFTGKQAWKPALLGTGR